MRLNDGIFCTLLVGAVAGCATRTPGYVDAVDRVTPTSTLPSTNPEQWRLAHIDIETTGLVPGYHEMIDVGVVITDLEGNIIDSLFLRVQPEHPERTSPGAARVNGFDPQLWRTLGALTKANAVDSLFAFRERVTAGYNVLMVAFNSQFDTAFLDHLLRSQRRSWRELYHYFVLDIPSMAWSLGYRDLTNSGLAQRLGVADEPRTANEHTGITGAMLNVRIYRAIRARLKLLQAG